MASTWKTIADFKKKYIQFCMQLFGNNGNFFFFVADISAAHIGVIIMPIIVIHILTWWQTRNIREFLFCINKNSNNKSERRLNKCNKRQPFREIQIKFFLCVHIIDIFFCDSYSTVIHIHILCYQNRPQTFKMVCAACIKRKRVISSQ